MRLFRLTSKTLISVFLVGHCNVILANAMPIKSIAKSHQVFEDAAGLEKNKSLSQQSKKLGKSGDVWERIRSGMHVSRPRPLQALPNQSTDSKNNKLSEAAPAHNYLYKRFGFKGAKDGLSGRISSFKKDPELKNNQSNKTDAPPVRVRTLINIKPQLHQVDSKVSIETKPIKIGRTTLDMGNVQQQSLLPEMQPKPDEQKIAKQALSYERINKHIIWYAQHRDYLRQVAERARPYLYHIVESLGQHKLPSELALLPIVESAYQPTAMSPKSAAGLWQFIPGTGQDFDLQQSDEYDERLDITASTKAAIRYLSVLKQHFNGDWLLALAAYNCGQGAVDEAIRQNLADGLDTDYWSLRLPEETQQYVPRFLALSGIFANPAAYGLKLAPIRNEPYFIKVKIDRKGDIDYLAEKDLGVVAQLADLDFEQFTRLNPGFLQPKLATNGPFTFLMPIANANKLHKKLTDIAQFLAEPLVEPLSNPSLTRTVQSVFEAQKNAPSLFDEMVSASAGNFSSPGNPFLSLDVSDPRIGVMTIRPDSVASVTGNHQAEAIQKENLTIHYVDNGETFASIAKSYGVSVETIRAANKFKPSQKLTLGQQVLIPVRASSLG
ncbi:MAG: transglycosylase SLT domain-containing protein [Methylococcaceae bacterium]